MINGDARIQQFTKSVGRAGADGLVEFGLIDGFRLSDGKQREKRSDLKCSFHFWEWVPADGSRRRRMF
jgi:hypothetical protein